MADPYAAVRVHASETIVLGQSRLRAEGRGVELNNEKSRGVRGGVRVKRRSEGRSKGE